MTIKMPHQDKPLFYRLSKLAVHAQFVWWLGHLAVVLYTPLYISSLVVFRGSMLSYGTVVWKVHKPLDISYSSLLKVFNDETTVYLSLACSWFFASPCFVSIFPFFVFSIFHCINYIRTRLFPTISPCAAEELKVYNAAVKGSVSKNEAPPPKNLSPEANFFLQIQSLTLEYYAPAMKAVSLFELIAIPLYLLVEFLRFKITILSVFLYMQFLLRRVAQSNQTKAALTDADNFIGGKLENPLVPPFLKQSYVSFRNFLKSVTGA